MAKATMEGAEEANTLAMEQAGSRKRQRTISQAVYKRITFDIIWQKQVLAILSCSNDTKSCYNRVVHLIVMMALQRLGVPKQVNSQYAGYIISGNATSPTNSIW